MDWERLPVAPLYADVRAYCSHVKMYCKRARLLSSNPWLFFLLSLIPYTDEIHFLTPKISGSGNISHCQQQSYSALQFPGATQQSFFYGGPRSNPFPLKYYFWQKKYLFQIPSTDKWYHFHIPSEEHCAPFKVAEHSFGSLWVYVICQIMAREGLQLTSWNLASEKYTDERFWLTGKIWHFRSFHGNMNDWIQP